MTVRSQAPGQGWLIALLLPLVATLPRFWNDFVFDDVFVILRGDFIHHLRNLPAAFTSHAMVASSLDGAAGTMALDTYRPLSIATFFWDALLSGRTPWAYHATNMLLHAGCCALLPGLLRQVLPALTGGRALTLACLFGLSPWLSEAHVFINGRSDLLLGLCALGAMRVHGRALARRDMRLAWVTGVLAMAGLLAKETMVMALPALCLVPDHGYARGRDAWRTRAVAALPVCAALLLYLAARAAVLGGLHAQHDAAQTREALRNLPLLWLDTLTHALLPSPYVLRNLRDDYVAAPAVLRALALSVLIGSAGLGAYALHRHKWVVAWALALAFATSAPAVMITTALWPGFGRYLYLPAVGLLILLGAGQLALEACLERARVSPRFRTLVRAAPVGLCALSAAALVDATLGFRNERTLYTRAFAEHPEQAWSVGSLGLALRREGRCPEALPLLAQAERLAPDEPRYALHQARCLVEVGNLTAARQAARAGQSRFHDSRAEAGFLVAEFLTLPPGNPRAEALMTRCLQLVPNRPDCLEGSALARGSQPDAPRQAP